MDFSRLLLRRIDDMVERRVDFAFETTLSGRTYARLFRRMRAVGFEIVLFYLWIPSAEFSAQRVASRVANGGHDIPANAIARRYLKSLCNLFRLYMPLSDRTLIFNNSGERAALIADIGGGKESIVDREIYSSIQQQIQETHHEPDEEG